jgi:S-adenosyl methyltransferase
MLTRLDLVEPGLVTLTDWHPESEMTRVAISDGDEILVGGRRPSARLAA